MSDSYNYSFVCFPIIHRQYTSCCDGCDNPGIGSKDYDPDDSSCCDDCALCCCFCGIIIDLFTCPCRYIKYKSTNTIKTVVEI